MKKTGVLAIVAVLMAVSLSFGEISPRQKIMAKRAAELDAYRNMAERIFGLRVSSESTVKDFLGENDKIRLSMDRFIKGIRIDDSNTVWYDDGSCEVTARVTLQQVIKELETSCDQYYKGGKWTTTTFQKISTYTQERDLVETGAAAVRADSDIPEPKQAPPVVWLQGNPRDRQIDLPEIYKKYPAQNRLMAKRVAQADAYRKLAERIYGFHINDTTTVRDFLADDAIRTRFDHFLQGAKVDDVRYQPDGVVEVQVSITMKSLITGFKKVCDEYYTETGKLIKTETFEEIQKTTHRRTIAVIGMGDVSDASQDQQRVPNVGETSGGEGPHKKTTIEVIEKGPEVIEVK